MAGPGHHRVPASGTLCARHRRHGRLRARGCHGGEHRRAAGLRRPRPAGCLVLSADEWQAVRLSLEVALWSLLWNLPVATAVAWVLVRRRFPGRTLLDAFVHLPLVLPPVLTGYLLLILFG